MTVIVLSFISWLFFLVEKKSIYRYMYIYIRIIQKLHFFKIYFGIQRQLVHSVLVKLKIDANNAAQFMYFYAG